MTGTTQQLFTDYGSSAVTPVQLELGNFNGGFFIFKNVTITPVTDPLKTPADFVVNLKLLYNVGTSVAPEYAPIVNRDILWNKREACLLTINGLPEDVYVLPEVVSGAGKVDIEFLPADIYQYNNGV